MQIKQPQRNNFHISLGSIRLAFEKSCMHTNGFHFQSQYTKSNTALNAHNATLLAAAGVDARLLSQMGNFNSSNISNNKRSTESPVQQKKEPAETQQQRQAAAKLALRKQLEKTLLQVTSLSPLLPRHENFSRPRRWHYLYLTLSILFADPTTQTSSTRNAFYPEPRQHGVYLLVRPRGVRVEDPEPGHRLPTAAHALRLLTVRHRLYTHLEVGQSGQR